jgi:hypothetical protein
MGSNPIPSITHYGVSDMKEIATHIALVKNQLEFHERQASRFEGEPRRASIHHHTAERFRELLGDLLLLQDYQISHPNWMTPQSDQPKRLALTWEEVEGLPSEVLAELSLSDSDRTEFAIVSAVRAVGGIASLDRIILHLYKATGELHKRIPLNQRLYRMTQKEILFPVPGKKGVYSLEPIAEEHAAALI